MSTYEYNKRYAEKYLGKLENITVRVPKGRKKTIEAIAAEQGESVNGLINSILRDLAGMSEGEWKEAGD